MRYFFFLIYFFIFSSFGHEYTNNNIKIHHPILKVVKSNSKMGAGYMTIINKSENKIQLINLDAKIAKNQEIHEVILENDMYKMRPITKNIEIKPSEELEFKPKSFHFMFFNINRPLKDDEMLDAKLIFKDNLVIPIKFKVVIGFNKENHSH